MKRKLPLIRHYQNGWPSVSGYPDDTIYSDYLYVLGKLPPNYPMPAIRMTFAVWYSDFDKFWSDISGARGSTIP